MNSKNEIAILDFGSQYTHLIARRVRELGVVSHIYANDVPVSKLKNASGVILSGGPRSLVRDKKLKIDKKIFDLGLPILGLCYGHQMLADIFGGKVASGQAREYGLANLKVQDAPIFAGVKKNSNVWMSHGDHVSKLPKGFVQIAGSNSESIAAMYNAQKKFYGFQFHPEVAHSKEGKKMLHNFIFNICDTQKNWDTNLMMAAIENEIIKEAQDKNVFLLVSGGVDSAVCFALLEKVLGKKRVFGLHIDSGTMRQNETKKISTALKKLGFDNLHIHNAQKEFLAALKNVSEPEQKRKIIGDLFLDITDRIMKEKNMSGSGWLLGQGTIYPDTIESGGTKNADVIKTHHNRVPRVQQMIADGKIIEPLKELYKDEVRAIGLKLGLPKSMVQRHPFPGPGLAIRCLCSNGSKDLTTTIAPNLLKLPVKSVGVQGDERSYSHPALLIGSNPGWAKLRALSPTITNKHKEVNRVLLPIFGDLKNINKAKLNKAYLTKPRLELLRKIDAIVDEAILADKKCAKIWQCPTVVIPFGYKNKESIVLRPVESEEAMTVSFAQIPDDTLKKIITKIKAL
ncbi:MAG: glutamine-hydrolyzing GMP synthase, partial [Candidatus Magasanikbacteria bacterium]|nr:glutamine-hydrolyzing GMP synthase [Candidatus Magasanikbacteria bacterium]